MTLKDQLNTTVSDAILNYILNEWHNDEYDLRKGVERLTADASIDKHTAEIVLKKAHELGNVRLIIPDEKLGLLIGFVSGLSR